MWFYKNDQTKSVFTAIENVKSEQASISLPKTALVLYMKGIDLIQKRYETECISNAFPRFLNACPIYKIQGQDLCILDGGRGAPMAADTLETLHALGVETVISVGQIGGFSSEVNIGDVVVPDKAYCEEGTSLHYYESMEYSTPDEQLFNQLKEHLCDAKICAIVSTDAVFRQTFYKERLWREKGCVGVDMETSALMSVGKYLNMKVASVLMVSDKHPLHETDKAWEWHMTADLRKRLLYQVIEAAGNIG